MLGVFYFIYLYSSYCIGNNEHVSLSFISIYIPINIFFTS